nr:reverse transcriptase domain-containing protein [Tanacetum cinerariifolium]
MHTRSSSNLPGESSPNPTSSNPKRRNRRRSKQPFVLEEFLIDTMADQRTVAELLRAPTEGYVEEIVVPLILAEQFELKHSLINMMTSDQFFGLEKDNPHDHICWLNKITSTIKYKDVPNSAIKDRYKDLLRACPHHGFTELKQLDTFYNALNPADQDSLNSAAGGNLLERRTQDVFTIIENKSKCLAADGNTFPKHQDNIQGYVAAAAVNYNQEKLGLPELISTRMTLELANWAIYTPAGIARDVFVLVGKFTFLADFIIVDDESDPRVPLILRIPFLRTARALIDVYGEVMILQSINMINIFNDSCEDFLEEFFATNHISGNPTFSSHPDLTSSEVKDDIFDPEGGNVLIEKFLDLDSTKELPPPHNVNPLSGSTTSSSSPNHLLMKSTNDLTLITFPSGNGDLPFDI